MPPVDFMKTSLDHLPDAKQAELARVQEILFAEFNDALAGAKAAHKKAGRILKIILFGSYARDDWVDEQGKTSKGYQSDYDILVIVNHAELTEIVDYWSTAEDRFLREIRTPVGLIVHTLEEVNAKLADGESFFIDILNDGIALYELPGHRITEPGPLTPQQAVERAERHFRVRFKAALASMTMFRLGLTEGLDLEAVFNLHQAVERLYACHLLTTTFYSPKTNNISRLRSLVEGRDARFRDVWSDENRFQKRSFQRLKEAYVNARYSEHYEIAREELVWIADRVGILHDLVKAACEERIAELKREAASGS